VYIGLSPKAVDDICLNVCYVYRLIGVEDGRLLGDQRHRWDPAAKRMFSVRKQSDSNTVFICAKAKRQQQQSAQPERKSTTRYG